MIRILPAVFLLVAFFGYGAAPASADPLVSGNMNNARMAALIKHIDKNYSGTPGAWLLTYAGVPVRILTDEKTDRMRIIVGVARTEQLDKNALYRMMQANFGTALDARYSIARGVLWSTFIHPLADLTDREFLSGLAQTINLATTYGSTYSSGALHFNGGDSESLENTRYRELLKKGELI